MKVNHILKRNIIDFYIFINQNYSYGNILKKIHIQKVKNITKNKKWKTYKKRKIKRKIK
jgi:hypothetical protein